MAKITLKDFWTDIKKFIANKIYSYDLPFFIAWTPKKIADGWYPPVDKKYKVLAEFDVPKTNRHYIIYILNE